MHHSTWSERHSGLDIGLEDCTSEYGKEIISICELDALVSCIGLPFTSSTSDVGTTSSSHKVLLTLKYVRSLSFHQSPPFHSHPSPYKRHRHHLSPLFFFPINPSNHPCFSLTAFPCGPAIFFSRASMTFLNSSRLARASSVVHSERRWM